MAHTHGRGPQPAERSSLWPRRVGWAPKRKGLGGPPRHTHPRARGLAPAAAGNVARLSTKPRADPLHSSRGKEMTSLSRGSRDSGKQRRQHGWVQALSPSPQSAQGCPPPPPIPRICSVSTQPAVLSEGQVALAPTRKTCGFPVVKTVTRARALPGQPLQPAGLNVPTGSPAGQGHPDLCSCGQDGPFSSRRGSWRRSRSSAQGRPLWPHVGVAACRTGSLGSSPPQLGTSCL